MTLTVRADRSLIGMAGGSIRHVLAVIAAPDAPSPATRPPLHVALVLDRSGSMAGEKMALAREAVEHALRLLRPQDRFSLVVFHGVVEVVVASTPATGEATRHALAELARVDARGSTSLEGGWRAGCAQVLAHLTGDAIGRCVLVTDGQATAGERDPDALSRLAAAMRQRGVATSTFGIGGDFDEHALQRMADGGRGHFYYVATPQAIPDLLASEVGGSLEICLRDVAVLIRVPSGVRVEAIGPYPVVPAGEVARVELGDLASGQDVQLVLRLTFDAGVNRETRVLNLSLATRHEMPGAAAQDIAWTFADQACTLSQDRDRMVELAAAGAEAARARQDALWFNRKNRYQSARSVLEKAADEIEARAGDDSDLQEIARGLREDVERFAAQMASELAKYLHFASYAAVHTRSPDGTPRKR